MSYLAWRDRADGKRCHLEFLENVTKTFRLNEGMSLKEGWPEDATFRMSDDYKPRIQLTDSLINQEYVLVVSEKLKAFLESNLVEGNEFLPVTIVNHKGRATKEKYFIANQVDQQDAFDQANSVFTKNLIDTTQIDTVKKMVIDFNKIKPTAQLFRLRFFNTMIVVREDLAQKITAAGITGPSFMTLDKYIEFRNS